MIFGATFTYAKVTIYAWCMGRGEKSLFWAGVLTQAGSAVGSLLAYFLVNHTDTFVAYYVTC